MENKKDCPMCKISDEVIKKLEQRENNKNNQNNYSMKNFNIIGVDVNVHDDVNPKVVHRDNLEKAMKNTGLNSFKILLAHSPDIIKKASANGIDFVLCGHTHGGQIRVPFIGPVYASSIYGTKYASGIFKEKNTLMYVSRGIGCVPVNISMSRLNKEIKELESDILHKTEQISEVAKQTALKKLKSKFGNEVDYIG